MKKFMGVIGFVGGLCLVFALGSSPEVTTESIVNAEACASEGEFTCCDMASYKPVESAEVEWLECPGGWMEGDVEANVLHCWGMSTCGTEEDPGKHMSEQEPSETANFPWIHGCLAE